MKTLLQSKEKYDKNRLIKLRTIILINLIIMEYNIVKILTEIIRQQELLADIQRHYLHVNLHGNLVRFDAVSASAYTFLPRNQLTGLNLQFIHHTTSFRSYTANVSVLNRKVILTARLY